MFAVVQTRKGKKSKPSLTVVPENWTGDKCVFWPPKGLVSLSRNPNTKPGSSWVATKAKVVGRANSFTEAEKILAELQIITDSEDVEGVGTRKNPVKSKGKFISNTYELQSVTQVSTEENRETFTAMTAEHVSQTPESCALFDSASAKVALPTSLPVPSNQVLSDAASLGSVMTIETENPFSVSHHTQTQSADQQIICESNIEYIQLENGAVMPLICEPALNENATEDENDFNKRCCHVTEVINRLDDIENEIKAIKALTLQMTNFMANMDKFMTKKNDSSRTTIKPETESFSGCKEFLSLQTKEDLILLEKKLKDDNFQNCILQYCKSIFNLTGKREGTPFFKTFLREILSPKILKPFSWQGNPRLMKNSDGSHSGHNESFRGNFPNFVHFVFLVIRAADFEFTEESNNKSFSNFLRMKNTEIKRFESGKGGCAAYTRKRKNPNNIDDNQNVLVKKPKKGKNVNDAAIPNIKMERNELDNNSITSEESQDDDGKNDTSCSSESNADN
ncbi:uncharacterized protein LOC131432740 [Malaya genurostris]|uniref:uncharacterized protein LOC131432740 n=1 Tax=Malaya genurostris TaxID=325434 RepID=UPI0026F3E659|nr:uncharacterized protein LOC131432740 [Malaya genurostris]